MEPITNTPQNLSELFQNHFAKSEKGAFDSESFLSDLKKFSESDSNPNQFISKIIEASKTYLASSNNPKILESSEKMISSVVSNYYSPKPKFQDVLFFPSAENEGKFLSYLKLAKKSLRVCVFTLSSDHIANCLRESHERGIDVRIITDDEFVDKQGSDVGDLAREGIHVRTDENAHALMHNKFCVIDDYLLITGSYNWTSQATFYNQENVVIIDNQTIVKQFADHFEELWVKYEKFNLDRLLGTGIHTTKLYESYLKEEEKKKAKEERERKHEEKEHLKIEKEHIKAEKDHLKAEKIEVEVTEKGKTKTTRVRKTKIDVSKGEDAAPIGEGSKKIKKQKVEVKSETKTETKTEQTSGRRPRKARKVIKEESLSEEEDDDMVEQDSDSDYE